jgi:hypothetical protein
MMKDLRRVSPVLNNVNVADGLDKMIPPEAKLKKAILATDLGVGAGTSVNDTEMDEDIDLDLVSDILELSDDQYPRFTLAKNKARFLRMVSWYKNKQEWLEVAPVSGVSKLFKQQTKELVGIRSNKLDYEMELETGTLTPSQRSYRRDELKMCKVHEKMAVNLISKMQVKIKSGRR